MPLQFLAHGKESGAKHGIKSDWRLVNLTIVVKIEFCLDIWPLLLDIYQWAHWGNLGRTFQKGVRPWAQDFVWPNASLVIQLVVNDEKKNGYNWPVTWKGFAASEYVNILLQRDIKNIYRGTFHLKNINMTPCIRRRKLLACVVYNCHLFWTETPKAGKRLKTSTVSISKYQKLNKNKTILTAVLIWGYMYIYFH